MTRIFTYQTDGDIAKHAVITVDDQKAESLIADGKAVKLDLPEFDRLEREASDLHDQYKADIAAIKNTDNPLLKLPDVQAYELDKVEREYREKSAQLQADWTAYRAKQLDEAKLKAARAVVKVTQGDRLVAEQFIDRASLQLATAHDKGEVLFDVAQKIRLLSDEQKTALQGKVAGLLSGIEGSTREKTAVVNAVQDVRNSDLLAVKVAEQLPKSVLEKQRISDIVKKVVGGN
ncbi:hypothetical protein [Sporosarcina sp. OR05]|uniref:hypothetical protein n=1 Tax=Sporosarcina sp. OR05 TaxID=2969819 RepID=UPI00352BBA25